MKRPSAMRMSFSGRLLARGFWLYVWRIQSPRGLVLYVGRTGDSASPYASSPFNRIGQHLDFRPKARGNALARQLKAAGIDPLECQFDMVAIGPIFAEQQSMEAHRPYRDKMAALEQALAELLRQRGYAVLGQHACHKPLDERLWSQIGITLEHDFPICGEDKA
ncbi:MAG: hypothetical protein JXQ75_17830 [Phycisphaerae bacterium]|nr:hypothetical protein [Phycisphaerae bacterium]